VTGKCFLFNVPEGTARFFLEHHIKLTSSMESAFLTRCLQNKTRNNNLRDNRVSCKICHCLVENPSFTYCHHGNKQLTVFSIICYRVSGCCGASSSCCCPRVYAGAPGCIHIVRRAGGSASPAVRGRTQCRAGGWASRPLPTRTENTFSSEVEPKARPELKLICRCFCRQPCTLRSTSSAGDTLKCSWMKCEALRGPTRART
jgi:hypothetical protein